MGAVNSLVLPLLNHRGQSIAQLEVSLLPRQRGAVPPPLVDQRSEIIRDDDNEPVQLLESHEYRYRLSLDGAALGSRWLEPAEMFEPDDIGGLTGRLRPGLATGRVNVELRDDDHAVARSAFEVRSRKLDYLKHYRWMLRDIGAVAAELIMERFAASEQRFSIEDQRDSRSLYQQFQFLRSALAGEVETALHVFLSRPYVSWVEEEYVVDPRRGVRMSSQVQREWARPGPRTSATSNVGRSFPTRLRARRTEATHDNIPNQFVKFALERWRDIALRVDSILAREGSSQPVARGRREAQTMAEEIGRWLAAPLFNEVEDLDRFPAGNQVLHKREGYREIFQAFVQSELASKIAWSGGDSVYSAGQRNVAALYEYWVFFEVARIISALCSEPLDLSALVDFGSGGLNLSLSRDRAVRVVGQVERLGRRLKLELWFNRTFSMRGPHQSWTRPMRPDVALLISCEPTDATYDDVWLHFDAKYRIDAIEEIMGSRRNEEDPEATIVDEEVEELTAAARRTDLLKMHAYKDAIHRSAGAYVLYPGTELEMRHEYHEVLPGVGAFILRPSDEGIAQGASILSHFIDDVITHLSNQLSQHERQRYWLRASHIGSPSAKLAPATTSLNRPPADTSVLLAYVKSAPHAEWIHRSSLYNLRADDRTGSVGLDSLELAAELLVLYGPGLSSTEIWIVSGNPQLMTRDELLARGYPSPRGTKYLCLSLGERISTPEGLSLNSISETRSRFVPAAPLGAPVVMTWLDLVTGLA